MSSSSVDSQFAVPETRYEKLRSRVSSVVNDHMVLVLLGPALLVILGIFVYPVYHLFRESLFMTLPGVETRFVPLYNYQEMLSSPEFWNFFKRTLIYSFGSLIVSFTSGLIVALAINKVMHQRLRGIYSTLLMFSWAIPIAVVGLIWRWILAGNSFGLLNRILMDLGVVNHTIAWLSIPNVAMAAVTLVDAWARMPFAMIVLLAGLQSIPGHMYDAAKVDGATSLQTFRAITIPYLRPYIAIVALINWMFAFRAFAIIYPMTQGGPGSATTTFSIQIYYIGMIRLNTGYAAAMSVFLVFITVLVAIFYVGVVLNRIEED